MGNKHGASSMQKKQGSVYELGQLRPSLSQLESLATTVPVNLNPRPLDGRHTPTRRSMQRSRLLNLHLAGRRRPRMRYYRFLIVLVAVQLFVGVTLTAVSIYASTVTPSLRIRDLPYWAGIPLSLSGLLGMIYITRCYGDLRVNSVTNFFKVLSATLAALTVLLCVCSIVFFALHLATFSSFEACEDVPFPASPSPLHSFGGLVSTKEDSNVGDVDEERLSNPTTSSSLDTTKLVSCTCFRSAGSGLRRRYIYERIACSDVLALVKFLFIVMTILDVAGTVDCFVYVLLLWSFRYKDVYGGATTVTAVN